MKNTLKFRHLIMLCAIIFIGYTISAQENRSKADYVVIITGYDWGPGVNKVVLSMDEEVSEAKAADFSVGVVRSAVGAEMNENEAKGARKVVYAYVSDEKGNRITKGNHVTLVLFVSPNDPLTSPIKYVFQNGRGSNQWIDYKMKITNSSSEKTWNTEAERIMPELDMFDLSGTYSQNEISLTYGSFAPQKISGKSPLIIWLHGGGEGGTDPGIALIANKATNYASDEIQSIFGGAYVLAPQTPTFWMESEGGDYTRGDKNDIYNEALMGLIKKYVADNPGVDTNRIYVGGCSNGGYMSLKLLLLHPDYFAAAYISALAYHEKNITDADVETIKNIPIWFVHSKDDPVTKPNETVVPLYHRLVTTGATNLHFSYYDHVTDLSGVYGGEDYHYNGHWSWIYSHVNHADFDFDGKSVMVDGKSVSLLEWMAKQSR
ncbi:MAG: prolyl oligopeptidase family serine peptidase [Maribacter sp.]